MNPPRPSVLECGGSTPLSTGRLDGPRLSRAASSRGVKKRRQAAALQIPSNSPRFSTGKPRRPPATLLGTCRTTVLTYLEVLELTHVATVLRPYAGGGKRELVRQPKIYGFDTGFVAYARGWSDLRPEDCGLLWEHLVLERLISDPTAPKVMYWRDKDQHEIDFVLPVKRGHVDAIECKWDAAAFDATNLRIFRALHPAGRNVVVATNVPRPYTRRMGDLSVTFTGLDALSL